MKNHFHSFCIFILVNFSIGCVRADEIDQLVSDLSNTNRLWSWNSGTTFNMHSPETTSTNDVIKRILDVSLPERQETNYDILTVRRVRIPNGLRPDVPIYTAAIVSSDGNKYIVLFAYWDSTFGWWSRVYDLKSEAIGHINLSQKGAICESEFVWPTNRSPHIVMEHSGLNDVVILTGHHAPFVIQMKITDKTSGQMLLSNSVSELNMQYDPAPLPSETIRIGEHYNLFRAGHPYILDLQVLQETKGLGVADVYFKR